MTQHITKAQAIAAARDYYERGKLGFQNGKIACLYLYSDGCRCAIGAVLDDEHIQTGALCDGDVYDLIGTGLICVSEDDAEFLSRLQAAHDDVCTATGADREYKLAAFRSMIGLAPVPA